MSTGTVEDSVSTAFIAPAPARIEPLIDRYLSPGPRYTSYPTAPVWTDAFGPSEFERSLAESYSSEVSIYVHVPFCEKLCTYCACNREIQRDHSVAGPYLDALELEAERLSATLATTPACTQLALGGGTPTYLSPPQLARLCDIIDHRFPPAEGAERSIEVDPRVTSAEHLETLAAHGFNRISLGVQDLSPVVQRAIRRVQSREQTQATADTARELGFRSVNFDLIYGLPYQTVDSFAESLDAVVEMRPDRIALYSYAHVTWVSKQQRGFERGDLPSASEKVALLLLAIERLGQAGYGFLGLDHFALPDDDLFHAARSGTLRRNFMGYTKAAGVGLLALGPSGISELADCYAQSCRRFDNWSAQLEGGRLPTMRGWALSADDQRRRWLIQRLMCQGEIDGAVYASVWDEDLEERVPHLEDRLSPFEADGLLQRDATAWRLTALGRIFLRPIAMTFDAYLPEPSEPHSASPGAGKRFSQTL
jgi:oxygen-independent coproporphyrinogen-3 oxidase